MKQFITPKEANKELSDRGRQRLLAWAIGKGYLTLQDNNLSIGQMIEFLGDSWHKGAFICTGDEVFGRCDGFINETLCDYLWEVVKEVLEK